MGEAEKDQIGLSRHIGVSEPFTLVRNQLKRPPDRGDPTVMGGLGWVLAP